KRPLGSLRRAAPTMALMPCAWMLCAWMLCAWTLGACGARTGPDGRGPDGGGGSAPDAGADAGAQLACDALPTSSEPIVAPPACELAWASCRPVVTSALLIPAPCGQLPTAVWTGEAILVGYDATAET